MADSLEKWLRLQHILEGHEHDPNREHAEIILGYKETIAESKKLFSRNQARIQLCATDERKAEPYFEALIGVAEAILRSTLAMHEGLVLLPRGVVRRELSPAMGNAFGSEWKQRPPSVILSTLYNAYEYGFKDVLEKIEAFAGKAIRKKRRAEAGAAAAVMELAFIDQDNTLVWPILAHEFGHSLYRIHEKSKSVIGDIEQDSRWGSAGIEEFLEPWIEEIFADLVSVRVFGPAGILPVLAADLVTPAADEMPKTHPPTVWRVKIVTEYLRKNNISMRAFRNFVEIHALDRERKLSLVDKDVQVPAELENFLIKEIGPQIEKSVAELDLQAFTADAMTTAEALSIKLADGVPISSIRIRPLREVERGLSGLRKKGSTPEETYDALATLNERPCSSAEIITAGWLYKLRTLVPAFQHVFEDAKPEFDSFESYIRRTDDLMLKSLEVAEVHRELMHVVV